VAQPENPALRSGSISKPDAHDFGRRVTASTSGLFGDPSRASAPGPHATPGRDVRDGPSLFGGCPGIDSGPRRLRAVVSRSIILVSNGQMRGFDSPRASLNGDAPVEPSGDGQSPLFGAASLPREDVAAFLGASSEDRPTPAQKSCKYGKRQPPRLRFQSSHAPRNRHRTKVDTAESAGHPG
jgi:hypothetical protein